MKSKGWFLGLMGFFSIIAVGVPGFAQDPSTSTLTAAEDDPWGGSSSAGSTTTAAASPVSTETTTVALGSSDPEGDKEPWKPFQWVSGIFDGLGKKEVPKFEYAQAYTLSDEAEAEMVLRRRDWPKPDPVAIEEAAKDKKPRKWQDPVDFSLTLVSALGGGLGGLWGGVAIGSALALTGPILWATLAAGAALGGLIGFGLHKVGPHKWIYQEGNLKKDLKENGLKWAAGIGLGAVTGLVGAMVVGGLAFLPFGLAAMGVGALAGFLISNAWKGKNSN